MKIRKIIATALAAVITLTALSACGSSNAQDDASIAKYDAMGIMHGAKWAGLLSGSNMS
ncbi:hypothetical protein [Bifidobacterium sp. ESL0732]|uniref:hypothetical protein n=1 Tax=Bifidobacterium sp. ESL0732 TaxID=2983222 RepID=UPI0023FA3E80|nr:hypothetical protein [Bifidobacterium sp. ESL0732]WEV64166.1 hypothetical protein OZX70_00790 [Bifidobacterium sp. ESL0732]